MMLLAAEENVTGRGGLIQGIVILVAVFVALFFVVGRGGHGARAWRKLAVILLGLGMIFSVLFPNVTSRVAHFFGVGRGADLLLYVFVLAFILYVLNAYVRGKKDHDMMIRLARRIALLEAKRTYLDEVHPLEPAVDAQAGRPDQEPATDRPA